jgi:uncharacterized membrane protein
MTSQPNVPALQTVPRPFKALLAISVAINLAVAGMIGGMLFHGGPGRHGDLGVRDLGFGPFDEALLPEDRDTLRQNLKTHLGDIKMARQMMSSDNEAILAALRSNPFDGVALKAALTAQTQHLEDRLKLGSGVMQDLLLAMPDAPRLAFADRLEDHMRRGRGGDAAQGN